MSSDVSKVRTTHVGSLPRPDGLIEANRRRAAGELGAEEFADVLRESVVGVVRRQSELGIDVVNDGEFGNAMTETVDLGAWASYIFDRLTGWEETELQPFSLVMRDHDRFPTFYAEEMGRTSSSSMDRFMTATFTGAVGYRGHEAVQRDLANLREAVDAVGVQDAFVTAIAPASIARGVNPYYSTQRDFLFAVADALHEEYQSIVDAGFLLQLDNPSVADGWEISSPDTTLAEYREEVEVSLDAVNHALQGIPRERVRYHVCWGSWHGPHTTDIPLQDILDLILTVNASAFAVEAGNVRHEHDWQAWRDIEIPDHVTVIPGVVSHATNLIETAELVAERILHYAEAVGRDRIMAGTDCGLGGRVHPEIAWAKLEALVEGARLASNQLWKPS
jgi:5-methyltetrahydropteroyltriglutamate--homocysteine methyltransferase